MTTFTYILGAALAAGGTTATIAYPAGTTLANFKIGGGNHKFTAGQTLYEVAKGDFSASLTYAGFTITLAAGRATIPAGAKMNIELDDSLTNQTLAKLGGRAGQLSVLTIPLGTPVAADTDDLIKAATSTELPNAETVTYTVATTGTSPVDGVNTTWTADVPRTVLATATHASSLVAMTITITGKDDYGEALVSVLSITATGTSKTAQGTKAFRSISSIAITSAGNAESNTLDIGFSGAIGLPTFLASGAYVLKEIVSGAAASAAGTFTAGSMSTPSTTTSDRRGLYLPDSGQAFNGQLPYELVILSEDPGNLGLVA